jgi:hypothetical protein
MTRPNLLVGHFPTVGPGSEDVYLVYGNFFYQNPTDEPLFQGEGNIALYDNLFVNSMGDAIRIQPHNDVPKMIRVFNNTVVAQGLGIRISGGADTYQQKVVANAVFASVPIQATDREDNITGSFENAGDYLVNPSGAVGQLDLYPEAGMLTGPAVNASSFAGQFTAWDLDFNGEKHDGTFRGAYAGEGSNPGWVPALQRKPLVADIMPPMAPTGLTIVQ